MTTDCKTGSTSLVYMIRNGETVRPVGAGDKAMFVSPYRGTTTLHIYRFFGESDKKFPTKMGMTLTRQEYEQMLAMQCKILGDVERFSQVKNKGTNRSNYVSNQKGQVGTKVKQSTNRSIQASNQNNQVSAQIKQGTNPSKQISNQNTQVSAQVKQGSKPSHQVNYRSASNQTSQTCDDHNNPDM